MPMNYSPNKRNCYQAFRTQILALGRKVLVPKYRLGYTVNNFIVEELKPALWSKLCHSKELARAYYLSASRQGNKNSLSSFTRS